jgi:hypothetical protein
MLLLLLLQLVGVAIVLSFGEPSHMPPAVVEKTPSLAVVLALCVLPPAWPATLGHAIKVMSLYFALQQIAPAAAASTSPIGSQTAASVLSCRQQRLPHAVPHCCTAGGVWCVLHPHTRHRRGVWRDMDAPQHTRQPAAAADARPQAWLLLVQGGRRPLKQSC